MNNKQIEILLEQILIEFNEKLDQRRRVLLEIFEGIFEHTDQWHMIRQKLLKFMGDSGLRGDFLDVIENARRNGTGHEYKSL